MKNADGQSKDGNAGRQKRRYVRLEIFSPVEFANVIVEKDKRVRIHPEKKAGILLNLSGGGALISTTDQVACDDLVVMKFDIKGFDALTDILCCVKRVEECEDGERLIGVQFMSPTEIKDPKIAEALSRLASQPRGFEEGIGRIISRYVFQRQVETETDE